MNKFTKIVLAVIGAIFALCVIVSFTACDQLADNNSPPTPIASPPNPVTPPPSASPLTVSYNLPTGWKWLDNAQDLVAITGNPSKDKAAGFVKLEPRFIPGTDADAKADIKNSFDTWTKACKEVYKDETGIDYSCPVMPVYKEVKIPASAGQAATTVYMAMEKSDVENAEYYWLTHFAFATPVPTGTSSKASYVMNAMFYGDRADLYTADLATIINTLRIKQ